MHQRENNYTGQRATLRIPPFEEVLEFDPEEDTPPEYFVWRYAWESQFPSWFVEAIHDYPGVDSENDVNMLSVILFAVRRGEPDQRIVFPHEAIYECVGMADKISHKKLRTGDILADFLDRVLPEVSVINHSFFHGRARALENVLNTLGQEIIDLRDKVLACEPDETDHLCLAASQSRDISRADYKSRAEKRAEGAISRALCEEQEDLLRYLHAVSKGRGSRKYAIPRTRMEAARREVKQWENPNKLTYALMQLRAIELDPCPRYRPSYRGVTTRIYTDGFSLATVNKELRRFLHPDWIELDLKSAHLAIAAVDWGLDDVADFLREGGDIWRSIYEFMKWEDYGPGIPFHKAKGPIKSGFYTSVFGGGPKTRWRTILKEYLGQDERPTYGLPPPLLKRFNQHPIVKRLVAARQDHFDQIEKNEGAHDAFGNELELGGGISKLSIASSLAQTRELKLLLPALRVAEEELEKSQARFWITLWQHDGFSVKVSDSSRRDSIIRKFKGAVHDNLGGYPTKLEVDYRSELTE